MPRFVPIVLAFLVGVGGTLRPAPALAHDPRTTAKKLSQGLDVEGVGRLTLEYRGLHFNPEMFERARANPGFMNLLNTQVWGRMGRAMLGFEITSRGLKLARGEYDFGVNMTPAEEFSVVLWQGEVKTELRLDVERDPKPVPYLTIALLATAMPDTFLLEARCGPYRGTVELKAPALTADHAHDALAPDRFAIPASDDGLPGAGPIRRYDWFQQLWRERRSDWARTVGRDQGAVVFLGDSITQGWGGGLGAAFPGTKVANRGISGDTTRGVLLRLEEDVLALHPAAVVLLIGTNDLEEGATPEVVAGNLKLIVAALKRHDARMPIVLCQVFPSSAAKKRPADQIRAVNGLYLAAVKNDPQVTYLETWPLFANPSGDATVAEFPDLLHPNETGYAKWAAALRPVFATLRLAEAAPDPFTVEAGFESLFNGRDLTGWGYRPTSEEDKAAAARWQASDPDAAAWPFVTAPVRFDGQAVTPDGRFAAIDGRLVVTTPPEHRKIQQLWTTREFPEDFVLKLEFRATPNADSGVYLRGPQLQCRDYRLAGPYEKLERYRPQEWNELVVTVRNGVARAECNGEVLETALALPASGPIGVEGDRGQMEYRRIRVKVLR